MFLYHLSHLVLFLGLGRRHGLIRMRAFDYYHTYLYSHRIRAL